MRGLAHMPGNFLLKRRDDRADPWLVIILMSVPFIIVGLINLFR